VDYQAIIDKYYPEDNALRDTLLRHSRAVTERALRIAGARAGLSVDRRFVEEAAMLHDIGIFRCDAPSIHCYGTEHYLRHGLIGGMIMRQEGFPRHARVCERHTGTGLTRQEIIARELPLPPDDFVPETLEEQLVCYADKFYSKSRLDEEKTVAQAEKSILKFGEEGLLKFRRWVKLFEPELIQEA